MTDPPRVEDPDPWRVEDLCVAMLPKLVGALGFWCGDRFVAEELAQETLSRMWEHREAVGQMTHPEAWAYRTAINLSRSWFRRRAAERRAKTRLVARRVGAGERELADAIAVGEAVAALPKRQREALVLRYYADLSVAEAAQTMGCSSGAVKAHTHKAIGALRKAGLVEGESVEHP